VANLQWDERVELIDPRWREHFAGVLRVQPSTLARRDDLWLLSELANSEFLAPDMDDPRSA
jgi:hypothetical protein